MALPSVTTIDGQYVLHFDTGPNAVPDAEIVARALIAWVEATQLAAQTLDPLNELRIGLLSAEPGSLRLRTVLDFFETKIIGPPADFLTPFPRIKRAARQLAIATTIGIPTGVAIVVAEHTLYPEPPRSLPTEAHSDFRADQEKIKEEPKVGNKVKAFYKTIEQDKAITGVSVREGTTLEPLLTVPREEFAQRSGLWAPQDSPAPSRPQRAVWDVVVTHPALLSKPKPWRFLRDGLPFSATMSDEQFLAAVGNGTLPLHIQEGVQMQIVVEWTEQLDGQTWIPNARTYRVTKVLQPRPLPGPAPLLGHGQR